MSSHPIDFLLLGNNFGTPEMREIWSEQNRLTQQINVEVALALAEGELGVIPQQAALSIAELANASQLNIKDIAASGAQMKHSLMPVLTALQQQCGDAGNTFITAQPRRISSIPPPFYSWHKLCK